MSRPAAAIASTSGRRSSTVGWPNGWNPWPYATSRRTIHGPTLMPPNHNRAPRAGTAWAPGRRRRTIATAGERRRRRRPERAPRGQVLVEELAPPLERHPERLVLLAVPAHRRLHDEAPLAQQVERRELVREQDRMAQRRDDRGGDQPQPGRRRRDGAHQDDRVGPGRRGILVARAPRNRAGSRVGRALPPTARARGAR